MAPRDGATGNKRKLTDRSKDKSFDKSSKKPKFEKRPPPPPKQESDDISDETPFEDFSDDQEDGGASLSKGRPPKAGNQADDSKATDADGKIFERG